MSDNHVHAVILAGGSGSRLWPLSRQHLPKQFLNLNGDASLLQTTISRLFPAIDAENVLVVTQESHAKGEAYHTLLPYQILLELIRRSEAYGFSIKYVEAARNWVLALNGSIKRKERKK